MNKVYGIFKSDGSLVGNKIYVSEYVANLCCKTYNENFTECYHVEPLDLDEEK